MKKINVVNDVTSLDQDFFNTLQNNVEEVFNGEETMGSIVVEDIKCKNLFNKNDIINGQYGLGGTLHRDSSMCCSNVLIEVEPNEVYTFSCSTSSTVFIEQFDENRTHVGENNNWGKTEVVATMSATTKYVRLSFTKATIDTVQFEKGSTATPYTEHKDFSNKQTYSTSEQVVGTWIDGSPIYKKTYDCGAIPSNDTTRINTGLSNVTYLKIEGIAIYNNYSLPLPFVSTTANNILLGIYGDVITMKTSTTDYSVYANSYVTVYYIKKTTSNVAATSMEEGV